jgi:hypothetical protein
MRPHAELRMLLTPEPARFAAHVTAAILPAGPTLYTETSLTAATPYCRFRRIRLLDMMRCMSDFWTVFLTVAGVVIGVVAVVLTVPPLVVLHRDYSTHVRKVWARVEPILADDGQRLSGVIIITNSTAWPVRDVIVLHPPGLATEDFESVGPGETRRRPVAVERIQDHMTQAITIQVQDGRGRRWLWTPIADTLSPIPPPISPLAKIFQRIMRGRRLPEWIVRRRWLVIALWGYHPEHGRQGDYTQEHIDQARVSLESS